MFTILSKEDSVRGALIVGLHEEESINIQDERLKQNVDTYIKRGDVSSTYKQVATLYFAEEGLPEKVYVVGLGARASMTQDRFRKAAGHAFQKVQKDGLEEIAVSLESVRGDMSREEAAELLGESIVTSTYSLPTFKTNKLERPALTKLYVQTDQGGDDLLSFLNKGEAYGRGVNKARDLVHLPANILTSTRMAEYATEMAKEFGMEIDILDKKDMEDLGMGALLAVNQGSAEPPKMIVMKYQGLENWTDVTAFVGKGITYDTGGYSIKTKTGMPGMKGDMGGAAAVLGAMETVGRLQPKKNVIAVIPSTDNMISGDAFKPDDVITSMSGQTIEVLNTDAEGRLALADGVTYAKREGAERIINVATLTGGVVTALGSWMTGAMTNNEAFYKQVQQLGETKGEPIWLLPYNEDYKAQVRKSDIADLNNSPTRKAHAIMGGAFVGAFVGDTPWVHLDIAGTSVAESAHELGPKGPTGVMAKTLSGFLIENS
ncbi:leucyl aminopeptidase [Halobacillus litoralis]|uniref:leucyl aminopeptidase n=1 Tax=Halobacillus litoralis TaxID=45668 RepID=UPI001CD49C07|nr:leucyl aminopeptidase [Halobacillus litoralis]MCA0971786.1 leucyl aminopeptidase [Halobacillus litoralis]